MVNKRTGVPRRILLGGAVLLPVGACASMDKASEQMSNLFSPRRTAKAASRGDRMARMVQNEGRNAMMAPEALNFMGITNGGRDVPAKLIGQDGPDGRYVVVLITMRGYREFIFHRKQDDVLMMHHCDLAFTRLTTVRYPHYGNISVITDQVAAENDFQQQLAYWFDQLPGR
jgi:hypothetical protein